MVILKPQSEFGHAPPPQSPYSIITNLPSWDLWYNLREGDSSPLARLVHIYPRFAPTHSVAQLGQEVAKKLGLEEKKSMVYLNPIAIPYTRGHATSKRRGEFAIKAEDLQFKCVEVAGHRIYAMLYEPAHGKAVMETWGNPGIGLSIRGAEMLLKGVDTMVEIPCDFENPPEPTFTPEGPGHEGIRERIIELLHRAPIDPNNVKCEPKDVFLFPTGMAAVYHTTNRILEYRPGTAVILGVVFHNTYHHMIEEAPQGFKHVGKVDKEGIDELEAWLEEETKADRKVSFVLTEFPGNPNLETPDLSHLKKLSAKYGFVFIVDDTLSGFGNVDVIGQSDILLTSLTKSFSGKADVLGGSIVLNQLSPQYSNLFNEFTRTHKNELFAADAEVLLSNSQGFFERTRILNRNAEAMANFLHRVANEPNSPITKVQYPTLLPTKPEFDAFFRPRTTELPEPGYGCLFTVEMDGVDTAKAFYDRCGFYSSPHLAGHVTLMIAYNMFLFGRDPEERAYFRSLGVAEEGIRISAGLENVEDLIDTLKDAVDAAVEAKKQRKAGN